ncbi:LysR substrate-binding domain-containing protein [Salinisphaera sp. Q1T1-3]|uniref:LysR substrate-binding domain-containing protein n=1 Tax=Salinisphaera sp. Q1T1-3 TaxID=2321229 RepID=UPI000E708A37|nr:LysR substrate-binding domain-containing protein [Salinisphaera sp. Q1T1-3]RJS92935.1 LysR family transcriptional regulator [Salinisphaera sp. Q1T1-3]
MPTDPSIRLDALETLDAIDRHGSFAAAAAALYRVPSAVSYTISQLESELGVAVFDRSGHRAVLTPAGRLLLDEGRRILTATQELGSAVRRLADRWEPQLRVAIDATMPPSAFWPLVASFTARHPRIDLVLREEVLAGSWEALIEDRVELAVGVTEPPAHEGIRRAPLGTLSFVFCCAPGHPLAAAQTPIDDETIRAHRALVVADSARHFNERSGNLLDGQPRLTVSGMRTKIEAIERGLGVGYCPAGWVAEAVAAGRLVELETVRTPEPRPTWVLWRRGDRGRALIWLIDALTESARAN